MPPRRDNVGNSDGEGATRIQIPGSSFFLNGHVLSLGLSFPSQVLLARYLSLPLNRKRLRVGETFPSSTGYHGNGCEL